MMSLFQLLPDEDLISAAGRWYLMTRVGSAYSSAHFMATHLNGRMPHHLCSTVTSQYLSEIPFDDRTKKAVEHSLAPFESSFLRDDERDIYQRSPSAITITGMRSTHIQRFRWCAVCVMNDEATFGVPYFHRNHQLPGVFYCDKHQEPLIESCFACGWHITSLAKQNLPPLDNICPNCNRSLESVEIQLSDSMQNIERNSLALARSTDCTDRLTPLITRVRASVGLPSAQQNTQVERNRLTEFCDAFIDFYSEDEIESLFSQVVDFKGRKISRLMRSPRIKFIESRVAPIHPLLYLMLSLFLASQGD